MKRTAILLVAAVFALIGVAYAGDREAARKDLEAYLAQRPLPGSFVKAGKEMFETLCDKEVVPAKAEKLVEKAFQKDPAIVEGVLKFVKESKEKGEKLEKAVSEKIDKTTT